MRSKKTDHFSQTNLLNFFSHHRALSNNSINGTIPKLPSTLRYLYLNDNNLSGTVPALPRLNTLHLQRNSLFGSLPPVDAMIATCRFYVYDIFNKGPKEYNCFVRIKHYFSIYLLFFFFRFANNADEQLVSQLWKTFLINGSVWST